MLKSACLPQKFWAEAINTAYNRVCHSTINDQIPFTVWSERVPSVRHLKVYGCLAYARLPDQGRKKFDDRAVECILVGYAAQTKGYRLWCPRRGDMITTKHVKFAEDKVEYEWIYGRVKQTFQYDEIWPEDDHVPIVEKTKLTQETGSPDSRSKSSPKAPRESEEETDSAPEEQEIVEALRELLGVDQRRQSATKYERKGKPKPREIQRLSEAECSTEQSDIEANLIEINEPQDIHEALASPQARRWKRAIEEEIDSLTQRKTWKGVELPEGEKCIGSKWVFKVKTDADGGITRYKARLVAQGFAQRRGTDYNKTYSPVANFSVIRLLLAFSRTPMVHKTCRRQKRLFVWKITRGHIHEIADLIRR